jgi:hypothetical protein
MARKKRSDRNHIIYQITNTITQETYIGVTVTENRQYEKSLRSRWLRHIYKANVSRTNVAISENIRAYGIEAFKQNVIKVVRGKSAAFALEAQIINTIKPKLNTRMQKKAIA